MNNERFLVFDIDDTLYSQMEPLLTACEFSLGRKLPDPELFYRISGKEALKCFCSARVDRFPFMNPGFTELKIL